MADKGEQRMYFCITDNNTTRIVEIPIYTRFMKKPKSPQKSRNTHQLSQISRYMTDAGF